MSKSDITSAADITFLIETFYQRTLQNPELAFFLEPISRQAQHRNRVTDYWVSHLMRSGSSMIPMKPLLDVVRSLDEPLERYHFEEWSRMWKATIDEFFEGEKANEAKEHGHYLSRFLYMKSMLVREQQANESYQQESVQLNRENLF